MKALHNFFNSGVFGFGLTSVIVKLFIGFGAITLGKMGDDEMTPQNFLEYRYGEMR